MYEADPAAGYNHTEGGYGKLKTVSLECNSACTSFDLHGLTLANPSYYYWVAYGDGNVSTGIDVAMSQLKLVGGLVLGSGQGVRRGMAACCCDRVACISWAAVSFCSLALSRPNPCPGPGHLTAPSTSYTRWYWQTSGLELGSQGSRAWGRGLLRDSFLHCNDDCLVIWHSNTSTTNTVVWMAGGAPIYPYLGWNRSAC